MEFKRPTNVDLCCDLRVMGWSRSSFRFETDEGDGYNMFQHYTKGEGPVIETKHIDEWIYQLNVLISILKEMSDKLSTEK